MRLLHTRSLTLHEFFEPNMPVYAILSHTWEEEEVLFADMNNLAQARGKRGFAKIVSACELARSQGYEYIWIDTCCIDKSSSAELTESINSMYRWYKNSDVCYAFLRDVTESDFANEGPGPQQLRSSRWFTRGWTLQELLAPDRVLFCNSHWRIVGNKKKDPFRSIVARITNIDQGILLGGDIHRACIARRMYWASRRKTTRIEDLAYCLLGIFGINMPLIYGEGRKAFRRLQEEILKATDDQSIFAWHSPSIDTYGGVLAREPLDFACGGTISLHDDFRFHRRAMTATNRGIGVELVVRDRIQGIVPMTLAGRIPFADGHYFIEAILDCQYGAVPGTSPTIFLARIGNLGSQRSYVRVLGDRLTSLRHSDDVDFINGDVVGLDSAKFYRGHDSSAWGELTQTSELWRLENISLMMEIPLGFQQRMDTYIPPRPPPFWLVLFSDGRFDTMHINAVYPLEIWDGATSRLSPDNTSHKTADLVSVAYLKAGLGLWDIHGVFEICLEAPISGHKNVTPKLTLIVGYTYQGRLEPAGAWCRFEHPPIDKAYFQRYMDDYNDQQLRNPTPTREHPTSEVQLGQTIMKASVRPMKVSGCSYYVVSVYQERLGDKGPGRMRALGGVPE